jgi:hypothetical protein
MTDKNILKFYKTMLEKKLKGVILKIPYYQEITDNCLVIIRKDTEKYYYKKIYSSLPQCITNYF